IPKYREHLVNLRTGIIFGLPSIVAIFATRKWVVPAIPEVIFQLGTFVFSRRLLILGVFAILLILASWSMMRGRAEIRSDDHEQRLLLLAFEGLLIGFLTG